jgi:hypothetical protein
MANTKIRLKSSGVTGNIPSSLQFGELALNYADGKLFFKRANNQISSFDLDLVGIQPDSFATINSNSTLILATSPTDTLSIVAGNNVSISTNSSSKTITINALSDDIDQIVRDIANTIAANTVYTQGVDAAQNTRINAAFAAANVGNTFVSSGGTVTGNVNITGSLTVGDDFIIEGNTTYTNTNSLQIDNPIIFLANNNVLGDTFDIGFVGLYNNGANSYTGLFRDPNLDEYFLFRDYTQAVQANTLININDASFIKANLIAGYIKANLISETATVAGVNILDFLNQISSNTVYTQGVDAAQNTRIDSISSRLDSAYAAANVGNNFVNTGGTVGGDVTITQDLVIGGNLTVLGTEVTLNTASIDIDASLLLLANNNTLSDAIDFGFVGTYNDGTVRRAGLFRDPNLKEFLFFDGYTPGVTSNTLINLNDSSFSRANIQADYFKGNLIATSVIVNGTDLTDKLNSLTSNTIYTQGVDTWQNTRITAVDSYAGGAYTQANAANNLAQSAFNKANNAIDQYSRDTANSASSNTVYTQGVDTTQNNRITAVDSYAGGAYTQANAANNLAQSAFNKANTNASDIAVIQGVDTTQNTRIQAAFDKANNASPMLKVASINSSNVYSNIVSNVSTIAFDTFTGFHVYDMGEGNVKISLGSTFSTWNVVGQGDLNAVGDDIIRINGANGIVITTNPSDTPYKSITFNGKTIFDKANSAYNMAEAADILAFKLVDVNLTQNTSIQAAFNKANSANVLAQAAYDKANTGTSVSLGGFAANNVLTVNSAGFISNTTNLNFYSSNNTLVITGNVVGGGIRSTSSASPPSNPVVGDIWYETGTDVIYRYTNDGTNSYWIDVSGPEYTESLPAHRSIVEFTATANQNSFSTIYNVNNIDVLRNGLRLSTLDYVANNGTSVILSDPCNANDIVTIINFYTTSLNVVLTANGRPSGIANGTIIWNTANNVLETYTGTGWATLASQNYTIQYLIVAGGGGGGPIGGGGGAGGLITGSSTVFPNDTYTFVIGAGGNSGTSATQATNGSNTTGFSLSAIGGGGGGNHVLNFSSNAGLSGGSGGGGADNGTAGGAGTAGQGFAGGTGVAGVPASQRIGGGGGGAGTAGSTAASGGHGGQGYLWLDGYYYSGGGGAGGYQSSTAGNGGIGGGGGGSVESGAAGTGGGSARNNGSNGAVGGNLRGGNGGAGTGGGGGGCSWQTPTIAAQGGSGTVIVRYSGNARGTGGTISSSGGFTYHVFTSSGTFTA